MNNKEDQKKQEIQRNLNPRLRVNRLIEILKNKEKILIVTHFNPDPDAIACAFGLRDLLNKSLEKSARICYGGIVGRAENKAMLKYLKVRLFHYRSIDFDDCDAICLVDTQPETGNNPLPKGKIPHVVVDHHPRISSLQDVPYHHVDPGYGASSSIIAHYFIKGGIPVSSRVATALLFGIKSDTEEIGKKFNKADREAYIFLYPKTERKLLSKIEHERVPKEYFQVFAEAIQRAEIYGPAVVTYLVQVNNPDSIAEIADFLIRLEGARWSLCMGAFQDALILSVRTSVFNQKAGELLRKVVGTRGRAGGHGTMAGGRVDLTGKSLEDQNRIAQEILDDFLNELGISKGEKKERLFSEKDFEKNLLLKEF